MCLLEPVDYEFVPLVFQYALKMDRRSFGIGFVQPSMFLQHIQRRANRVRDLSSAGFCSACVEFRDARMRGHSGYWTLIESAALVTEAIRRVLDIKAHEQQIIAGMQLCLGRIIEMKTGEGKTLTGLFPTFFFGAQACSFHVLTCNDYLSVRDHEQLSPVLHHLGLTTGSITSEMMQVDRVACYNRDVTYLPFREVGFDILRDRIAVNSGRDRIFHRPVFKCLIDEVDSLLLDEARTPLIIAEEDKRKSIMNATRFRWASQIQRMFEEGKHFLRGRQGREILLSQSGRRLLRSLVRESQVEQMSISSAMECLVNSIRANRDLHLGQHYDIKEDRIKLIDEYTGRIAEGKQLQNGMHQSVEAKEGLEISPMTFTTASIGVQQVANRYVAFCGMTGTAWSSRSEFWSLHRKRIVRIACRCRVSRQQWPPIVVPSLSAKLESIVSETSLALQRGQAVLIGTTSVAASEWVSSGLMEASIRHMNLNARNHALEAEVVSLAGQPGAVTVATNMAGRGTDIKLGGAVREAGGLHVILTELHDSERIDWQLIGRCARQGDPGSFRVIVSIEDKIIQSGLKRSEKLWIRRLKLGENWQRRVWPFFERAQRRLEAKNRRELREMTKAFRQRTEVLERIGIDPYQFAS